MSLILIKQKEFWVILLIMLNEIDKIFFENDKIANTSNVLRL